MVFVTQNTDVNCPGYAFHALEYMSGFERWARKNIHNVYGRQIEKLVTRNHLLTSLSKPPDAKMAILKIDFSKLMNKKILPTLC